MPWTGAARSAESATGSGVRTPTGPGITPTIDGRANAEAPTAPVVTVNASKIGRFTLLGQIGQGGMGSVFAAYDEQLDRRVALKLLHQSLSGTTRQRQRTLREAQAVARISHPNVIAVYEVGESAEHIFIAMEYVDGETLHAWQSRGSHTWREILEMYLEAGAGLNAAHQAGVVHCDFKSENVLVSHDGRVRVVDFGLARIGQNAESAAFPESPSAPSAVSHSRGRLTIPGTVAGTPGYMPPEQHYGGNIDSNSDQWSFCAALFEALYGYLPFDSEAPRGSTQSLRNLHGVPRPAPRDTKVPEEVHRALLRGLSPQSSQRFASMAELLEALSLEHGDHAAGGVLFRTQILRLLVGAVCVILFLVQIRQSQKTLAIGDMILVSFITLAALLGAGVYSRRTLFSNRFNRSLWFVCLVIVLENLFQRIATRQLGLPIVTLFPFEMIVLSGSVGIAAVLLLRELLWLPAIPLIAAALSISGHVPMRILSLTYLFVVLAFTLGWHRAATARTRQRPSVPPVSGRYPIVRPQRTPSYSPLLPSSSISGRPASHPRPLAELTPTPEGKRWEK